MSIRWPIWELKPPLVFRWPLWVHPKANVQVQLPQVEFVSVAIWHKQEDLVEGPAPGNWWTHSYIAEGEWEVVNFQAMNHTAQRGEVTLTYYDGVMHHAIGNHPHPEQYQWVRAETPQYVWPGCFLSVIWRDIEPGDDLRVNFTLKRRPK